MSEQLKAKPKEKPDSEPKAAEPAVSTEAETESVPGVPLFLRGAIGVSQPGDSHERDARETAARVMSGTNGRRAAGRKSSPPESIPGLSSAFGQPLDSETLRMMEPRFGQDFGQVRVHTGAKADAAARAVHALAFTRGQHIVFAAGQYKPATPSGRHLIAHELAHVSEQAGAGMLMRQDTATAEPTTTPAVQPTPTQMPPVLFGMDTTTRRIYVSVTVPGHTLTEIATYIYGSADKAAELQSENGVSEFVTPGRVLRLVEGTLSEAGRTALNAALDNGSILRTKGIPSGETSDTVMVYRFSAGGTNYELTEGQMRGMLTGLGVWIYRKADYVHGLATGGQEVHQDHLDNTNSAVRGISDWLADQDELPVSVWNNAINTSQNILDTLRDADYNSGDIQTGLTQIPSQAQALERAARALDDAKYRWHVYIEQTIAGAEIAVNRLEIVRNVSFGIAAGLAGAIAAPAAFAALGAVGVSGGTATVLSIGAAGTAGGVVRGGLEVAAPGAQADRPVGERFQQGFESGFIQGSLGGAGAFAAPATSGVVATQVGRATGTQFLTTTAGRYTVNAITGGVLGVPSGAVGASLENLRALQSGQISQDEYWRRVGSGAMWGGALGIGTSFIPIHGLSRQGGVPFRGDVAPPPRWMFAGPASPLQQGWSPPPGFNRLTAEQLPPLMEGYAWIRTSNGGRVQWEPFSLYGSNSQPVTLRWYDTPTSTSPTSNYNLLTGNQLLGSRGTTRAATDPYAGLPAGQGEGGVPMPGAPRSGRRDFPIDSPDFIEQGGTRRYVRGHNVDFRDTTGRTPQIPDSNLDPANFTPEPDWWGGLGGRNQLVRRIVSENPAGGGQYRQFNIYRENPPVTQNGTPIPDRIIFVQTDAAGVPVRAWEIPFGPTAPPSGPVNTAANIDAAYSIPLNRVPQGLLNATPLTPATGTGITAGAAGSITVIDVYQRNVQ